MTRYVVIGDAVQGERGVTGESGIKGKEIMSTRTAQCSQCGHLFNDEQPYFSEDFATYVSQDPMFVIRWCLHCSYLSIYERRGFLGFAWLKLTATVHMKGARDHPLMRSKNKQIGGFAIGHLMRMIWYSLLARVALDGGEADKEARAMHLALQKLPPAEVALMAFMAIHAQELVPLEQQIIECQYLGAEHRHMPQEVDAWISSSPNKASAEEALRLLAELSGN